MMEISLIRDEELEANKAMLSPQMLPSWGHQGHIDLAVCSEGEPKSSDELGWE